MRIVAALLLVLLPASAMAGEGAVAPQARTVDLINGTAVVYQTGSGDKFEVVTTVATSEAAHPVRFIHQLTEGQTTAIEVDQGTTVPQKLILKRTGDDLIVDLI